MDHHHHSSRWSESREISLRVEHYEDIFSDFDSRPYSKRALSVDFLDEIRRASRDKNGGEIELVISVPKEERNESHDQTIRERLADHFHKHHEILKTEKRKVMKLGYFMVFLGVLAMISATYVLHGDPSKSFWQAFLVVFLEPAAWFLLWEGMDQIIFNSKSVEHELSFYRKMSSSNIHFHSF